MMNLLHNDCGLDYARSLPLKYVRALIVKGWGRRNKQVAWELYLTQYPKMNSETFIPFSEFYDPDEQPKKQDNRTAEEILAEVKGILDGYGGEKNRSI